MWHNKRFNNRPGYSGAFFKCWCRPKFFFFSKVDATPRPAGEARRSLYVNNGNRINK
jgi:hypothetical protein